MSVPAVRPASQEAFAQALLGFINQQLPKLHPKVKPNPGAAMDTQLFTSGLMDSMSILHLITFIERATGKEIPPGKIVMKHFESVAAIAESFWEPI